MIATRFGLVLLAGGFLLIPGIRMSADEQPKEKTGKERVKEFVYPGVEKLGKESKGAGMYQAKFTTPDDAGKVADWYRKALGFHDEKGIIVHEELSFKQPDLRLSMIDDSRQPGSGARADGEPRPLTLRVLVKKTADILVVAVVSRGKDEKRTHVALTLMGNKVP
jgi:hypothetical protein